MKYEIDPFDFTRNSMTEIRVGACQAWASVFKHRVVSFNVVYFKDVDGADMFYSTQLEVISTGYNKEDAIRKLVFAINGYYGQFLIHGNFPNYVYRKEGLTEIKIRLRELGWIISEKEMIPPDINHYLKIKPEFKDLVLNKFSVEEIPFEIEIPILT